MGQLYLNAGHLHENNCEEPKSLFGDLHMHGLGGVYSYGRTEVITQRWPDKDVAPVSLNMPIL